MATTTDSLASVSVASLLTGSIRAVRPSLTLRLAAELLAEDGIGLLVVENAEGDLAGVLSERDLVAAVADGTDLDAERLGSLMADEVVTVTCDGSLGLAATRMVDADVRHLVVVDDRQHAVGVVSARDVMRALVHPDAETLAVVT